MVQQWPKLLNLPRVALVLIKVMQCNHSSKLLTVQPVIAPQKQSHKEAGFSKLEGLLERQPGKV